MNKAKEEKFLMYKSELRKAFYENKASKNWKDVKNIKKVDVPWYRSIFE